VDRAETRRRFANARVAVLATVGPVGPHVVPVVFVVDGDRVYTAVDHKPKRSSRLQRLRNIDANPAVSLLVDGYDEDWNRLWWVRVDGSARVVSSGYASHGLDLLQQKYPQYRDRRPGGPVVVIAIERWVGWSAT
jgi:PPOX class probable F420-dependent enzyme